MLRLIRRKRDKMTPDEELTKLGFTKKEESEYWVTYERTNTISPVLSYTHILEIVHKDDGNHTIYSYGKGTNGDGFNNAVGLTYQEAKAILRKYKELVRIYGWE